MADSERDVRGGDPKAQWWIFVGDLLLVEAESEVAETLLQIGSEVHCDSERATRVVGIA